MAVPSNKVEHCEPIRVDLFNNLQVGELESILQWFEISGKTLSTIPAVLPKEGELYIFDLGSDTSQWEKIKKKLRWVAI